MKKRTFYLVDVFAEEKYAGNQLAVVRDAEGLSDTEMQRIAKEMNYSETTFILSDQKRNGGYDVRIFTPEEEVPFAGHPTLGTAYVIQHDINLNVRVFVDYYGIPEDPATGSANGCLAGYLAKYRYFGKNEINIKVEQGYEIGRPSLLLLRAKDKEEEIDVFVGGKVVMVAKGELL